MRIASRDLQVVSVGLVSAVLLAGCSGNSSKPTVLPPLTTSATPAAATAPAPAPTTTPAPSTSAPSSVAEPSSAAPTPTAVATSASVPNPSQGDPAVASKMIAVIRDYYATLNAATHNAALLPEWRAKFLSSCATCLNEYNVIKKELDLGTTYVGGGYQIQRLTPTSWDTLGGHVDMSYFAIAGKAYNKAGKLIDSVSTTKLRKSVLAVEKHANRWYVVFLENPNS